MKTMNWKKALLMALCVVLIAAAALFAAGHFGKQEDPRTPNEALAVAIPVADGAAVGQGERAFTFAIVDKAGAQTTVAVSTDKTTVGDALVELGLIEGEMGPYGLYVKKVNGIAADFDADGTYWAFYIDGTYGMTGVDKTDIMPGSTYMMKVEK